MTPEAMELLRECRYYLLHKAPRHDLNWRDGYRLLNKIDALLTQSKAAPARVADGVAAIPSVDEVTAKAQSSAAPDSGEGKGK